MEEKTYGNGNKPRVLVLRFEDLNDQNNLLEPKGKEAMRLGAEMGAKVYFYVATVRDVENGLDINAVGFLVAAAKDGTLLNDQDPGYVLFNFFAETGKVMSGYSMMEYDGRQVYHAIPKKPDLSKMEYIDEDDLPEGQTVLRAKMPNSKADSTANDAVARAMAKIMAKKTMGDA
jgi:hypothetical protein